MRAGLNKFAIPSALLMAALSALGASGKEGTWLLRAFVPNSVLRQGEVRVVETPESVVVQTLLYTRFPDRVLSSICAKEEKNWPVGSACREDAMAYCRALKDLPREWRDSRRADAFRWMIEFIADARGARVEISEVTTSGPREELLPARARALPPLAVSEPYVLANMGLILSDIFGSARKQEPEVLRLRTRLKEAK